MTLRNNAVFNPARKLRAFLCLLTFLFFPGLLSAIDLPFMSMGVRLVTSKPAYFRYEFVEFLVEGRAARIHPGSTEVLDVRIVKDGQEFPGLPYRPRAQLRWDANRETWVGRWPVPWNPPLGTYHAELLRPDSDSDTLGHYAGPGQLEYTFAGRPLARTSFEIVGRKGLKLEPGFSAVTLEPGRRPYSRFPGVHGEKASTARILDWAKYMHADAFWHAVGLTQIWGENRDSNNYPWVKGHLVMMDELAAEAHSRGVQYGAYILTFLVSGTYFKKSDYIFTTAFDKESGGLYPLRFISLMDERRHRDVVALLKSLNDNPNVDFLGMDYFRTDKGGLEFTDRFLEDMDVRIPPPLKRGTVQERQLWLGHILVHDEEPELEDLWNWWRAHKTALVLKAMLEEAAIHKPVWIFSLSWEQGHHHGQDPFMLVDAGLSINAPMFYHANEDQFPQLLTQWKNYLKNGEGTFVLGQPVDSKLLKVRAGLAGPQEHYDRQVRSLAIKGQGKHQIGFFWHDLDRAASGSGFSMREWAVSGAATFSRAREAGGGLPLTAEIVETELTPLGVNFDIRVTNISENDLRQIQLDGMPMQGIGEYLPERKKITELKAGRYTTLKWQATWEERNLIEGQTDRRMIAARVKTVGDEMKHPSFVFKYVGEK